MLWKKVVCQITMVLLLFGLFLIKVEAIGQSGSELVGQSGSELVGQSGLIMTAQSGSRLVTQSGSTSGVVERVYQSTEVSTKTESRYGNPSRGSIDRSILDQSRTFQMNASAYTLSEKSCGKSRESSGYGITATGEEAQEFETVSVDPEVIPLGTKVYIEFPENFSYRDGVYIAQDTGGYIHGNKIDIFFGEDLPNETVKEKEALQFGRRMVTVYILEI